MYLQMIICRGHKTDSVLQLYDALLQVSPRFCSVGQVEVGIPYLFSQQLIFLSQGRFGSFRIDQKVLEGEEERRSAGGIVDSSQSRTGRAGGLDVP